MKTIWKFELKVEDKQTIIMPVGAEIISVQSQHLEPVLWAMVKTDGYEETEGRIIEVFGTGQEIPEDMGIERIYLGTFQLDGGSFVGHVFERIN